MIAVLLLAAASAASVPADWCDSLATVARTTAEAQRRGEPRGMVEAANQQLPTSEARAAAHEIAELAYALNTDGRLSPTKFADLVRQACMHSEQVP